jgi:ABC-type polysaccharide/polyol phosphate export permease
MSLTALIELTRMRVLLLLRQPEVVFWAFVFPVMLSMVLGFAFSRREAPMSHVVVVEGPGSRELLRTLKEVERVDVDLVSDTAEVERRLRAGATDVVVTPGTGDEMGDGMGELRWDDMRPEAALARLRVEDALQRAAGRTDPLPLAQVAEQRTGNRWLDWFVPGLLGLSIMSTSIWAVGFAFVEARQRRLIKRFLVTPMERATYLLSHVLGRLVLLVFEVALLLAFARLVLGVPFRGSPLAFLVLCFVGATIFAGLGVLLGSRVRTVEAAAGLINLSMMPMGLASGVFFSYERFADALHGPIRLLPLTALNDALRAVMLDGRGLGSVVHELVVMTVWGVGSFLIGLRIFRWK